MKKILKKIDQLAWRCGRLLYRIWFQFKGTGKFDDDSGAEFGKIKRRFFN